MVLITVLLLCFSLHHVARSFLGCATLLLERIQMGPTWERVSKMLGFMPGSYLNMFSLDVACPWSEWKPHRTGPQPVLDRDTTRASEVDGSGSFTLSAIGDPITWYQGGRREHHGEWRPCRPWRPFKIV